MYRLHALQISEYLFHPVVCIRNMNNKTFQLNYSYLITRTKEFITFVSFNRIFTKF